MHVWSFLGLLCEGTAAQKPGVSHDSPRAETGTFQGSGLQKHPERRATDTAIMGDGAKFWRITCSLHHLWTEHFVARTFFLSLVVPNTRTLKHN